MCKHLEMYQLQTLDLNAFLVHSVCIRHKFSKSVSLCALLYHLKMGDKKCRIAGCFANKDIDNEETECLECCY